MADAPDPLLAALASENLRLRDQVDALQQQVAALRRIHRDLVSSPSFRLTAPLRRIQEESRRRRQDRRRAERRGRAGASSADLMGLRPPRVDLEQAARHPVLARTRAWADGAVLPIPERLPPREPTGRRVLVVAHVFYADLWDELAARIERIPEPFDLVVTLVRGVSVGLDNKIAERFPHAMLEHVDNRGRDMLPLLHVVDAGLISGHDAVLKVHTKKSAHRRDGQRWRTALLDSLCPDPQGIGLTLELLRTDPEVGMVAPEGYVLGAEFWGTNGPLIEAIAARVPQGYDPQAVWFPAGSMFWARPEVLLDLQRPNLTADDFEYEVAALDGTTAHALERYLGVIVAARGWDVVSTAEVAGQLARARLTGRALTRGPV